MSTPSFKQRLRRLLRNHYWQSAAGIVLTLLVAGATWLYSERSVTPLHPVAHGMTEQLRHDDRPWSEQAARFSDFAEDVRAGKVAEAVSGNEHLYVTLQDGRRYAIADPQGLAKRQTYEFIARDDSARFRYSELKEAEPLAFSAGFAIDMAMRLMIIGVLLSVAWPMLRGFISSHQRRRKASAITFNDVIGCGEAKQALLDIATAQRHPERFSALGARPPRGVLLTGSPGTGKTHLAKALAAECGVNFIAATGSDFSSMFYGVGIIKVRNLFRQARRKAPCILLIDEIDGIGKRAAEPRMGEAEQNRIVNQFLTEMASTAPMAFW
jgi:cell division protease FtsH